MRFCCPPGHGCNAPGGAEPCFLALCRSAGEEEPTAARAVARHYGVRYWALDALHAPDQEALYRRRARPPWLQWVTTVDGVQIYEVDSRR